MEQIMKLSAIMVKYAQAIKLQSLYKLLNHSLS